MLAHQSARSVVFLLKSSLFPTLQLKIKIKSCFASSSFPYPFCTIFCFLPLCSFLSEFKQTSDKQFESVEFLPLNSCILSSYPFIFFSSYVNVAYLLLQMVGSCAMLSHHLFFSLCPYIPSLPFLVHVLVSWLPSVLLTQGNLIFAICQSLSSQFWGVLGQESSFIQPFPHLLLSTYDTGTVKALCETNVVMFFYFLSCMQTCFSCFLSFHFSFILDISSESVQPLFSWNRLRAYSKQKIAGSS